MKIIISIAITLTILAVGAFMAYAQPEIMPKEMKSLTLNAEAVLIAIAAGAGAFWVLAITMAWGKKAKSPTVA